MKILLLTLFGLAAVFGRPNEVSVDEVFGSSNSARYGGGGDSVDQDLIDDAFGEGKDSGNNGDSYSGGRNEEPSKVNEVVDNSYEDCAYYKDQDYQCVPYYDCEDGEIVTDGGGLIDIRSSFNAILDPASSKCPGYLEVCCRHPDFSTNAPVTTTPEPITTAKPRIYKPQCGKRNIDGIGVRIQNDKYKGSTQFGEWPHMCAVLEKKPVADGEDINLYVCGASLIAPGVVLTGAHCVAKLKPENIKIRCGEWDTQKVVEPSEHQDRYVQSVRIDPLFDPKNLKNDFALLFMESDFHLASHIDTICLPDNLEGIYSYEQRDCVATGWGKDKFGKLGEYQVIMKQVQMDIVNSTECERRLRRTRLGLNFELDESFICAGGEKDKDTCKGDGGGPLVCPVAGAEYGVLPKYVQAGIIAWGIDCGVEGNPGVYANVADGLCFIDWATRCETGIPQYFDIKGCDNWAENEIYKLQEQIQQFQKKLETITKDGSGTPSNLRNLKRRIRRAGLTKKAFEETVNICIASSGYGQGGVDNGDIDIASLGRSEVKAADNVNQDSSSNQYVDPANAGGVGGHGGSNPGEVQIDPAVNAYGKEGGGQNSESFESEEEDGYSDESSEIAKAAAANTGYRR